MAQPEQLFHLFANLQASLSQLLPLLGNLAYSSPRLPAFSPPCPFDPSRSIAPLSLPAPIPPAPPVPLSWPILGPFSTAIDPPRSYAEVVRSPKPLGAPTSVTQPVTNPKSTTYSKAASKLASIRIASRNGFQVCYRCGDRGHLASHCHNSLVCFDCGRLEHRSTNCRFSTLAPPPKKPLTPAQMADTHSHPLMKFYPNAENKQFRALLTQGIVFHDLQARGAIYLQTHLTRAFPS